MYDLKKSAFGGYNKKQVDALILELDDKVKNLSANAERLKLQLREANAKLDEDKSDELKTQNEALTAENRALSEKSSALKEKNLRLESELDALKNAALLKKASDTDDGNDNQKSKNHMIKAYTSGYDIVQKSLTLSDEFFNDVQEIYKNAELSATKAINEYETVGEEIEALLSYINSHITSVRDETKDLILKAKLISSMLSNIDNVKQTAKLHARKRINEYEQTVAEFIKRPGIQTDTNYESEISVISDEKASDMQVLEEPADLMNVSEKSDADSFGDKDISETDTTVPEQTSQSETLFSETVESSGEPTSALTVSDENREESDVTPSTEVKPEKETESENSKQSFTQFGHKSRLSGEERARLIKQLLASKNK